MAVCAHRAAAGIALQPLGSQRGRCRALRCIGDHRGVSETRVGPWRWPRLGALIVDDFVCSQQAAADRIHDIGVDRLPAQGAAAPVEAALQWLCCQGLFCRRYG